MDEIQYYDGTVTILSPDLVRPEIFLEWQVLKRFFFEGTKGEVTGRAEDGGSDFSHRFSSSWIDNR
jgi:hypothetical protein